MSRYTKANCKLCRRNGEKLFLKGARCHTAKCAIEKRNFPPGSRSGSKRRLSEYGIRLREKQKLRFFYGVTEGQIRNYYEKALRKKGATGQNLLALFEQRLDNFVFRSGLAASRKEARQLVLHGHFLVNGIKVNVPSVLLRVGDVLTAKSEDSIIKVKIEGLKDHTFPRWIEFNAQKREFKLQDFPRYEEIDSPVNMQLIVEYYSR